MQITGWVNPSTAGVYSFTLYTVYKDPTNVYYPIDAGTSEIELI